MLEVIGVSVRRGGLQLFQDFSLTLPDPGLYVITGGTASGKTLLGKLLAGMLRPTRGRVQLGGTSLYPWLAFGQGKAWYSDACCLNESAEPAYSYVMTTIRDCGGSINDFAAQIGECEQLLGTSLDAALHTYSSGQRALMGVLLALHIPAPVVVLDGHLSGIDAQHAEVAGQLLADAAASRENYFVLLGTRFSAALNGVAAIWKLAGGLPVSLAESSLEEAAAPGDLAPEILRLSLRGGVDPRLAYESGESYIVLGLLENGLRIKPLAGLETVIEETRARGLVVQRIEWE